MIDILKEIKTCNVSYHVLGKSDRSAMPIGNGELCASVWTNEQGEICFYLSRSDALTELDRTVKLGVVKIAFEPNPFISGNYCQTLDVADGCMTFQGKDSEIVLCIDPKENRVLVQGTFGEKTTVTASYYTWRIKRKGLEGEFYTPNNCQASESADVIGTTEAEVFFFHKNGRNLIKETARLQEVPEQLLPDLLTDRIFGGSLRMDGDVRTELVPTMLSKGMNGARIVKTDTLDFLLQVTTLSMQGEESVFRKQLKQKSSLTDMNHCLERCKDFWNTYWKNSYIIVKNDIPAKAEYTEELRQEIEEPMEYEMECQSPVTAAYVLTRFMMKCCGTGKMPILYNGMLFHLCPGKNQHYNTQTFGETCTAVPEALSIANNPDERSWCIENLWQNVRHPYHTFLAQGEMESMKTLFSYYRRFWDLNRYRAEKYYGAEGQHNTEMTMSFGLPSNSIYGEDRTDMEIGYVQNRHGGAVDISPGLELLSLMLDYYDYTKDETFFREEIQIYAKDLFRYIETRFPGRENGKMILEPLNSIETYWDTKNPITVVAGLKSNVNRLLKEAVLEADYREYFEEYTEKIPEIAVGTEEGRAYLQAAEVLNSERMNVEIPELYACFPFDLYHQFHDPDGIMKRAFEKRIKEYGCNRCFVVGKPPHYSSYSGWQYQGIVAAELGMTELAEKILCENVQLRNPGTRFPVMWGPIYDGVPDTDHGANIVHLLQKMVLQVHDKETHVLPAFPKEWDVAFKLHVDAETVEEGVYKDGVKQQFL